MNGGDEEGGGAGLGTRVTGRGGVVNKGDEEGGGSGWAGL